MKLKRYRRNRNRRANGPVMTLAPARKYRTALALSSENVPDDAVVESIEEPRPDNDAVSVSVSPTEPRTVAASPAPAEEEVVSSSPQDNVSDAEPENVESAESAKDEELEDDSNPTEDEEDVSLD